MLRDEYWQERTLIAAHTKEIIDLLAVKAVRYAKIRQFYDTSCINYEALRAMKGHTKVEGLVSPTLAKLPGIKADRGLVFEKWLYMIIQGRKEQKLVVIKHKDKVYTAVRYFAIKIGRK